MSLATVGKRVMNWIVVWTLATALLAAVLGAATPAAAQNCDRTGAPTAGDWTIAAGDTQVCTGIVIVMDGNLNVQGSLTIQDGGLKFVEDASHVYQISVTAGGDLTILRSSVWTETTLVSPYLKLDVTASGVGSTLTATDATFAFPGTMLVGANAIATFTRSTITRTTGNVDAIFGAGSPASDDNNDPPGLTFDTSTVSFFDSRVERLYENTTMAAPDVRQAIRLLGNATLTAVNTFLGIDFNDDFHRHNTLSLAGTSDAYLYGITTDEAQNPSVQSAWQTAITATAGTRADLYRWADVRVVDLNGVPVDVADINADFAGPETGCASFRETVGCNPPANILAYLGKTAVTWDDTGVDGLARMPLLSDWIDSTTMPNSRFVGTYNLVATAPTLQTGDATLTFDSYPLVGAPHTAKSATISIVGLVQPLPDLVPITPVFAPATPLEGDTVAITAPIRNQGAGGAANVVVRIFDGVTLLTEQTIPFIAGGGGQQSVAASLVGAAPGQHVIRVSADPNNAIVEGPGAGAETNNVGGFPLPVTSLGPDLSVELTFSPDPGFLNNPVRLDASVTNVGHGNATDIVVNFYQQAAAPDATNTPIGTATIPFVDVNGTGTGSFNWTPTSLGSFPFWAWADPNDAIPEPAPYDNAGNNQDTNTLSVGPAPDLVVFSQDLTMIDPFPRVSASGTIEAVVRNAGQAAAGPFRVDFFVDGVFRSSTNHGGLAAGARLTSSVAGVSFTSCGSHTVGLVVDAGSQVNEGALYEQNNAVTQSVQVFPGDLLTWSAGTVNADQAVSKSIEVNGTVTISGARILIVQDQDPCGRYYVKVLATGNLILDDATLESNWPLVVYVAPGGTLTATSSTFTLDVQGKGALHSKGTLSVWDSTIMADLVVKGTTADLRGDTFGGGLLHIDTATTSRLWDASLFGVQTIQLSSDAPGPALVDFDIRNVTFSAALTAQLVFSGDQLVQLTSVALTKPGDWWTGIATQNARVTRYWWLNVETVDGTGTPIQDASTVVKLERFNPNGPTPGWEDAPTCTPTDCYLNTNATWYVGIPTGRFLYRASAEDRFGSAPPDVRATYRASGSTFIEGSRRFPDALVSALVEADTVLTLTFSELTPDLSVTTIAFDGRNGPNIDAQPANVELTISATVANTGEIITRGVTVFFYSTDVDVNRDGYLDNPHSFYVSTNAIIGSAGPLDVPALSSLVFQRAWTPTGSLEGSRTVTAFVDPELGSDPRAGGAVAEANEGNNLQSRALLAFVWPDLHLATDPVIPPTSPPIPIVNNPIQIRIEVTNEGTNGATDADFGIYTITNGTLSPAVVTQSVARGARVVITLTWTPTAPGPQAIRFRAIPDGSPGVDPLQYHNYDFDQTDNYADRQLDVQTEPELSVTAPPPLPTPFRGQRFDLNLSVANAGQTDAFDIALKVYDNTTAPAVLLGALYGLDVGPGSLDVNMTNLNGIGTTGDRSILVWIDANNTVTEPNEANNRILVTIRVEAPAGEVRIQSPTDGQQFQPGVTISVRGRVIQTNGDPIGGVLVNATLRNAGGTAVATGSRSSALNDGSFLIPLAVPANLADGIYTLVLDAQDSTVQDAQITVRVNVPLTWWAAPFLGLPVWIWLLVVIGAVAAIGGGTAYVKFVGLGKLVECGECGAFIQEDSTTCPKCGVEFEKDMAKCSNCQAWIPVDVKQCPECGVEFATGEVEMADYEAKMRQQYEEVKRRFRDEASRELGRSLNEREFEDWWRTQPTFVTFEDWLREEEEMRRMGSKPCPVCNTLNSVTATVCHKCGTLLKEAAQQRPRGGTPPARPATPAPQPIARPAAQAPEEETGEGAESMGMPSEAIPKKVVRKPLPGAPVVQKKVIRRPLDEQKEGEGGTGGEGEQDQI